MKGLIFFIFILFIISSCQRKEKLEIKRVNKDDLINDWIHNDYQFILSVYDSVLSGVNEIVPEYRTYKITSDTLLVDYSNKVIRQWSRFKILKLNKDSLIMSRLDTGWASIEDSILRFHSAKKNEIKNFEVNIIEFSSSPHHGDSPIINLRINDDCEIFYEGEGGETPYIGKFCGRYDEEACLRIKKYLELFDFQHMPEELGYGPIGNQHYYFKINYNDNQEKDIYDGGTYSIEVLYLVKYLLNLHTFIDLQSCDSVDFEISTKNKLMQKNY